MWITETKQWHKDDEEVEGCIDSPSQDTHTQTEMRTCHVQLFLFKMAPPFSVPLTEPQNFSVSGESSNSVNLSWEAIPTGKLRGFLSHYSLCSLKFRSEQKDEGTMFHFHHDYVAKREEADILPLSVPVDASKVETTSMWLCWHFDGCCVFLFCFFPVCYKVSASVTEHHLVNLTPGSTYSISLAAVTGAGEGPRVVRIINTPPENVTGNNPKPVWSVSVNTQDLNASPPAPLHPLSPHLALLWVLSVLFVMFLISTLCTCMLRQ